MINSRAEGLPPQYTLELDSDILTLRRTDGSKVAVFSSRGATPEVIRLAAEEDSVGDLFVGTGKNAPPREGAPPQATLRVHFLGKFGLLYAGTPSPTCRSAKALAIMKYLLAHKGRPVSRDFFMGWLWPDVNLKKARWSLNSSVHALRRFLADCLPVERGGQLLVYEEGHYRLCLNLRVESDVEEFDERYASGRRLEQEGGITEAALEYAKAVDLYRGDYLSEDLYEDWTMVERERLASAYVYMLDRLADYYAENGCHQASAEACYRILQQDPCHEGSHRRLISHYVGLGLRDRAVKQYQVCTRAMKVRYGADPSPDTHFVYRSIFVGKTSDVMDYF